MDGLEKADLIMKRREAYHDGVYELDDWEGFTCTECGNRQISAAVEITGPDDGDDLGMNSKCDECGSVVETSDQETKWDVVEEKLPEEYLSGEALETDLPVCPACGRDILERDTAVNCTIGNNSESVHEYCAEKIWNDNIENPRWYDNFTPEHYEKAANHLRSLECVGDVITHGGSEYRFGEMRVYTNYATSRVVKDVVEAFNATILSVRVATRKYNTGEKDKCFEIIIDFHSADSEILPPEALDEYSRDEGIKRNQDYYIDTGEYEKTFSTDFSKISDKGPEKVPDELKQES